MKTLKKILALTFVFAIVLTSCISSFAAEKAADIEIYVDGSVEVSGNGSFEAPFKSIEEAQAEVRKIKKEGRYPQNGIDVIIRGGIYKLTETIKFTAEDSGMKDAPVTYKAYPLEEVNFVGGTEFKFGDMEPAENSQLPDSVSGKIYSYNLKKNGVEPYDKLYCTGHSLYYMGIAFPNEIGSQSANLATPEVFFNDQPTTIARYPNGDEYLKIGTILSERENVIATKIDNAKRDELRPLEEYEVMKFTFSESEKRLEKWTKEKEGWLFGYWRWDWSDQTTPIREVDPKTGTMTTEWPSAFGMLEGQRFYAYNMLCELDTPGEWYYDRDSGEFYLYPLDENKDSKILLGFMSKNLVEFDKCSYIEFYNLNFAATRRSGIVMNKCTDMKLFGCTVSNVSGDGINIPNGYRNIVDSCHVYNTGSKGVVMHTGDVTTLERGEGIVQNCWIHDFARLNKTYNPGIHMTGVGNTARFNLIHGGPHAGMRINGCDNVYEYNDISDVMKEAADMGAIYSGLNLHERGNITRGNVIHDLKSNSEHGALYGFYTDNCGSGHIVTGNLFYNLEGGAVFINGGRDNVVTGNTFANVNEAIHLSSIGMNSSLESFKQQLELGPDDLWQTEPYHKYPNLQNIFEDEPQAPKYNQIKDNINYKVDTYFDFHSYGGATETMFREWSDLNNGITLNKGVFVDEEKGNYALTVDVKDKLPNYEAVDFNKAGLITSRLKNGLSDGQVAITIGKPIAYVNWNRQLIDENNIDVVPQIKDNLTYVPVRFLAEMLGAEVEYDNGVVSINYNGSILTLTIGSDVATIDGKTEQMPGKCFIENERTLVPLRACGNMFQKEVFWDDRGLIIVGDEIPEMDDDMIENLIERM